MSHNGLLLYRARALQKAALDAASSEPVQASVAPSIARQTGVDGAGRRRYVPYFAAAAAGSAGFLFLPRVAPAAFVDRAGKLQRTRLLAAALLLALAVLLVVHRLA